MLEEHPTPEAETLGERHLRFWLEKLDEPCFVYVLQSEPGEPIKVGIAKNVKARIRTLQTGNPFTLRAICVLPIAASSAHELEWQLHYKLKDDRLTGEWFKPKADFLADVAKLAQLMVNAYDDCGRAPWYRQFGTWKHHRRRDPFPPAPASKARDLPPPVPPEEAAARLKAHYLRPQSPGVYWDQDGKRRFQENIA